MAVLTQIQSDDLNQPNLSFYWVDGGDSKIITCTITVNGNNYSISQALNVKRPTNATVSTTTGTITLQGQSYVGFGTQASPGITFTSNPTIPTGFDGAFQWVQVATVLATATPLSGGIQTLSGTGCDSCPYATDNTTLDRPGTSLNNTFNSLSFHEGFTIYLMFKPSSDGSIWVPLRKVDWYCNYSVSYTNSSWSLNSSGNSSSVNPADADCTEPPTYTSNIRDATYH